MLSCLRLNCKITYLIFKINTKQNFVNCLGNYYYTKFIDFKFCLENYYAKHM